MFKNLFSSPGKERAASPKGGDAASKGGSGQSKKSTKDLLAAAQSALQRLRVMQPSDTEAFPLLNEASRYGRAGCAMTATTLAQLAGLHTTACHIPRSLLLTACWQLRYEK